MKRILKLTKFSQWARKAKLSDRVLQETVEEIIEGLVDADLGRGVIKKRVPLPGRGKRKGARTLLATNWKGRWVFLYGFSKNERENVSPQELEAWQELASDYLRISDKELDLLIDRGSLVEVLYDHKK